MKRFSATTTIHENIQAAFEEFALRLKEYAEKAAWGF
jgi:hypothetical protein